jgi:hypothetical protein
LIDEIVAEELASPDLELHWLDEDEGDPETVLEGRLKVGALTLNEMGDALGLDPFDNAAADRPMVLTATGFVPIEANAGGPGANAGVKVDTAPVTKTFNPNQSRVPAGNPGGGQWTTGDGGSGSPSNSSDAPADGSARPTRYAARDTGTLTDETPSAPSNSQTGNDSGKSPAQVAANEPSQQKPIDLLKEEAPRGVGHTIAEHVGKSDDELLEVINRKTWTPAATLTGHRQGSFDSIGIAQDLVNRTLDAPENAARIADVVSGKQVADLITSRFDFITGREWYRPEPDDSPYLRVTSGVGVVILHDPGVPRGYRVLTAYPRND